MINDATRVPCEHAGHCVDLIGGPGALRSMTAICGFLLVMPKAEIKSVRNIIAVSGATIPFALLAAGYSPGEIVKTFLAIRPADLIDWERSHYDVVSSHLSKGRRNGELPETGVYRTARLGEEIERLVAQKSPGWPQFFSVVAVDATARPEKARFDEPHPQILMNSGGTFRRRHDGLLKQLSDVPVPLGLAIRASCAVPMVLEPIRVTLPSGENLDLVDGAISWEGAIPLGLIDSVAPAADKQIIIDVGDEPGLLLRVVSLALRMICGRCLANYNTSTIAQDKRRTLINPTITAVRSFDFYAERDIKWLAIVEGFVAAVYALEKRSLLVGQNLEEGKQLCESLLQIVSNALKSKNLAVSDQIERLLAEKGWL